MRVFGATDVGCVRRDNQDCYAFRQMDGDTVVVVVCDGMGGAQAGSVASTIAVETFSTVVETELAGGIPDEPEAREDVLANACQRANRRVYELSRENPGYRGMGTTLVAALVLPDESYVVNVGDSRCYLLERETIRQVTVDHSVVQLLVDRGEITAEEARVHPKKNLITRALGVERTVSCDILRVENGPGSRLLLCSDGLSNVLSDGALARASAGESDPELLCRKLLDMTLEQGAPDNVTIVLAQL